MLLFNFKHIIRRLQIIHFNTSNVTIQLLLPSYCHLHSADFNTSNVTIQLLPYFLFWFIKLISIHLMLLFNIFSCNIPFQRYYFNTSNVTIQLTNSVTNLYINLNFNTSNVTIQPTILSHLFYSQFHYTHYISTFS